MGFLRLFLALSVIAGHSKSTVFGFNGIGAWYAVQFFFIISGFYMAMVLNENNEYKENTIYFYKSRFLRLFPVYYIGLLLGIFVSWDSILDFFNSLSVGSKIFFIFQNLFIFGQDLSYIVCSPLNNGNCANPVALTINPPAWSLSVELGFYLIAPFFLKNIKRVLILFFIGVLYLIVINNYLQIPIVTGEYFKQLDLRTLNYYFYASSFIFFSSGALVYYIVYKGYTSLFIYPLVLLITLILSFTNTIMPFWHLLFISLSIPIIFKYTKNNKIDRIIGELSYPAYILHFPILLFLKDYIDSNRQIWFNLSFGTWVAIFSCLLGIFLWYFIDRKINNYRHKTLNIRNSIDKVINPKFFILLYMTGLFFSLYYLSQSGKNMIKPYNLTDVNWKNGISIRENGFFIGNSGNINIKKDYELEFPTGIRKVVNVQNTGAYINIFVDGEKLDPIKDGYPNKIKIIEKER